MKKSKEKVIVGISGGVDSSVTAGILKRQGYDVVGVFMRLWKSIENKKDKLLLDEIKKIGETLDIPIRIVDVRKEFREKVVDYFLKEYAKGKTPNPCIFCNENLKFKILFQEMKKMKADYVATGHYVLTRKVKSHPPAVEAGKSKVESKEKFEYKLFEAKDKNKDQSYFLYRLKQEQLAKIIFPLGIYQKEDVRKLAKKFNLPNFEKKESQDICF
jgi:tRNA-uridine 2-sulfurtransferase